MQQTVYVDLFFMINFSMDFLCFFLTCQLLGIRLALLRTLAASALGGIYAVAVLFIEVGGIVAVLLDIAVCGLMCGIAFASAAPIVATAAVYVALSMVLGGFMTALFSLLNRTPLHFGTIGGDGMDAYVFALLALVSAVITALGGAFFRRRVSKKYATVTVCLGGRKKTLDAFCDSGNLLCDPISLRPCVLADIDALGDLLPRSIADAARSAGGIEFAGLCREDARRIRMIPAQTAMGEGLLIALRMDEMLIGSGGKEKRVDALLALCPAGRFEGGCQALIPSQLLM